MEEEMLLGSIKIKEEDQDLEEAFNQIMGQEEIITDEMIQDEIIKNEMLFDDMNGDDILGSETMRDEETLLVKGGENNLIRQEVNLTREKEYCLTRDEENNLTREEENNLTREDENNLTREDENNLTREIENNLTWEEENNLTREEEDLQFQNLREKYTYLRKLGLKSHWLRFKSSLTTKKKPLRKYAGRIVKSTVRKKGGTQKRIPEGKQAKESESEIPPEERKKDGSLLRGESSVIKEEPADVEDFSDKNADTGVTLNSDEMLYCDECCRSWEGDCPVHGSLFIVEDTPFPDDVDDKNRAEKSSPPQISVVNTEAESGVWAREAIPARTRFGPFEGKQVPPEVCTAFSWLIHKDGQPYHTIDATEPSLSNWMRYVNCARHNGPQNLHAFQYEGKIFYRTIRAVDPGEELLVWFGEDYGRQVGIGRQIDRQKIYKEMCLDCPYPCGSPMYLMDHKKRSHGELRTSRRAVAESADVSRRKRYRRSAKLSVSYTEAHNPGTGGGGGGVRHRSTYDHSLKPTTNPKTGELSYACPECNTFILRRSHLKRHLLIHSEVKPYICQFCNKGFARKDNFDSHLKIRHARQATTSRKPPSPSRPVKPVKQIKPVKTEKPAKTDKTVESTDKPRLSPRGHLSRRQPALFGEKEFVCSECKMRFSRAIEVRVHMAVHVRDKPFVCSTCLKRFVNKSGLVTHQKTHKAEGNVLVSQTKSPPPRKVKVDLALMCRVCGLQCKNDEDLTTHEHTHEERFSICFVCNKKFSHVNHLKRHLLIHAGYRPHGCPHCGQDFSRTEHLKRHITTHTRQGAYECSKCKKRFAKKMDFERHVRLHNKDAPCLLDQRISMNINLQKRLQSFMNDDNDDGDDCDGIKQETEEYDDEEDEPLLNVFPEVILGAET